MARDALRTFDRPVQVLVVNQFGILFGFYLVVPFLAAHLTDALGMGLSLVALVLSVRVLAQQGLFLLCGTLADWWGPRPMIVLGCLLRVVGFGLFALSTSTAGIVLASVLTGLAGALFTPAVRAYVTAAAGARVTEAFGWFTLAGNAGTLLGPVVGSLLLGVDFRWVALAAALVFALLTVAQLVWLPRPPTAAVPTRASTSGRASARASTLRRGLAGLARNRPFAVFALSGSALFAVNSQLFFLLPHEAALAVGASTGTLVVFTVSTVCALAGQRPLTRLALRRWGLHRAIWVGFAVAATGFLAAAVLGLVSADPAARLAGVLVAAVTLAVGGAISQPFVLTRIGQHAPEGLTGTYFGAYYLVAGLVTAAAGPLVGALLGRSPVLAWLWCGGVLVVAALVSRPTWTAPVTEPAPRAPTTHLSPRTEAA